MMKKLSIYEIRDKALASKRAVYSVQQLANLIGKPKKIAKVYMSRLVKKGLARKIHRGKISFVDDTYVIASQLFEPSYISLVSALVFHGVIQQIPKNIECVSPKNSRKYIKEGIIYHKIPRSLYYGYERYKKSGSYIFVADPEKATIDGIYLNLLPKNIVKDILNEVDKEKLKHYLSRYKGRGKKKLEAILNVG
jgi:predicted transcriptional regulator of viral defense system